MKKITLSMLAAGLFLTGISFAQTTVLSEDFESVAVPALPAGWTTTTTGTDAGFTTGTDVQANSAGYWPVPTHGTFAMTNDDACNCDKSGDYLILPAVDLTGLVGVRLSFNYLDDRTYGGTGGSVELNINSGGWNSISTLDATTIDAWEGANIALTGTDGAASVEIRIKFDDGAAWGTGIAVDDVWVYVPADKDAGVSSTTVGPYAMLTSGAQSVTGVITNYGTETLTSVDVSWSVDGGPTTTQSFTGLSIATMGTYAFTHSDTWTPPAIGTYTLTTSTSNPNGGTDQVTSNDSYDETVVVVDQYINRLPLFENFTSSTCPPCVPANATMLGLLGKDPDAGTNADKWAVVKYQMSWPGNGDPYYTDEGGTRRSYYGVSSVPNLWIDGGWGENGNSLTQAIIDQYAAEPAFLDITATYVVTGQTVDIDVTIDPVADIPSTDLVLHMAIVENETYQNIASNGETEFQFVMKKMVPDAGGTAVGPFTNGTTVTISDSYTFNGSFVLPPDATAPIDHSVAHTVEEFSDLSVVVWVQDVTTKEIQQAAWGGAPVGIETVAEGIARLRVYPNPFNQNATIEFSLEKKDQVSVEVLNVLGNLVYSEDHGTLGSGSHKVQISGESLVPGIYFVKIQIGESSIIRKVIHN